MFSETQNNEQDRQLLSQTIFYKERKSQINKIKNERVLFQETPVKVSLSLENVLKTYIPKPGKPKINTFSQVAGYKINTQKK